MHGKRLAVTRLWLDDARVSDALLAVVLAVILVTARAVEAHGLGNASWWGYLLSVLAASAIAFRGRWPLAVFTWTLALCVLGIASGSPTGATSLTVVIAVYTVAQVEPRWRAGALGLLAGISLALARGFFQYRGWSDARTAAEPALALAALFLGWAISNHRAYISEIEARMALAERTREEEARRLLDAERMRIARELHDVLAHGIATISLQAGVAVHVFREHPEQAEEALQTIKATSKRALREVHGVLGVLRDATEHEPREPMPGLGGLDRLIDLSCDAGLTTRLSVSGQRSAMPPSVDLAAYRIIQESLTNVLRHAAATSAAISIEYAEQEVMIVIDDDGRPGKRTAEDRNEHDQIAPTGHGILGMCERAQALGGELHAGPRAEGGFRVRARLPLGPGE